MQSNDGKKKQYTCQCGTVNTIDGSPDVIVCVKCERSQLAWLVPLTPALTVSAAA